MPTMSLPYKIVSEGVLAGEPIRNNNWEVIIAKLPNILMNVKTMPLPNYSSSPIEIYHFNEKLKVAGAIDLPSLTLEVYDTVQPEIFQQIWDWWTEVYDCRTGQVGYAETYKCKGTLTQYTSKGDKVRDWDLIGLWPVNVNPGSLDYSSADPVSVSIELSIDKAIPLISRSGGGD
jgi:hypothetical protein